MDADTKAEILRVLQRGTMDIEGILPWSSNYAFLVTVCENDIELPAVYKPRRGERPLWDFPQGTLSLREQAAFVVSEELGWDLVPPTVLRDGRHGPGSVQLFIAHDPEQHYFSLEGDPIFRLPLQKMALMDVAINNADRKGGHVVIERVQNDAELVLPDPAHLWGIDHGICFHSDDKLRTVIWEFAGMPIPPALVADLAGLAHRLDVSQSGIINKLAPLLSRDEFAALTRRVAMLVERQVFPNPGPGRHYPWPPV
jgi:hypothetical protein